MVMVRRARRTAVPGAYDEDDELSFGGAAREVSCLTREFSLRSRNTR